jgi:hypothetical protein
LNEGAIVTRSVRIAGGQEAAVSIFQPPVSVRNQNLEIQIEGVDGSRKIPLASLWDFRYDNTYPPAVLTSRSVPQEFRDKVHPAATTTSPAPGTPGSSERVTMALLRSELPTSQWSTNWLGYSCYDAILLTEQEANEMPPQVQQAVRRFIEAGGVLMINGRHVPGAFSQGGMSLGAEDYGVGFGHVMASREDGPSGWDTIRKFLTESPLPVYRPEQKPTDAFSLLVAEATVPVRGLFVLVLVFGIGIGPINLWLLSRLRRRIWLWWNVPVISLLTCLLVFAYSLASEGIVGRGKTASMTLLDERNHHATTLGYLSYYCPLTPSVGPRFSTDTDVALLDHQSQSLRRMMYRGSTGGLRVVDWTSDQYLQSGWVNARVPACFQIRKNEDRRERLTIETAADGTPKIVNALGANIQRLYWADASGRIFEGRNIAAGAEKTLAANGTKAESKPNDDLLRRTFLGSSDWPATFYSWTNSMPIAKLLAPGCYLAFLDGSPFVEPALESVKSEHTVAIVYGISKGANDGR